MHINHFEDRQLKLILTVAKSFFQIAPEQHVLATNISGMTLHIGKIKESYATEYQILIRHGKKNVGAITLTHRHKSFLTNDLGFVFEPHAYMAKKYRGRKYIYSIYSWLLDNGIALISGKNQTIASNNLWKKLGKKYRLSLVNKKTQEYLTSIAQQTENNMHLLLRK